MKVLQVHNAYRQRGGEDTIVETEAQFLEEAGHTVVRFAAENPDGAFSSARALALSPKNPAARHRIVRCLRRERPDVAHVHNTWFSLSPDIFHGLRAQGVPIVMTLQNYRLLCANALMFRDGAPCQVCLGRSPWSGVRYRCYRGSAPSSALAALTIEIARRRRTFDLVERFLAPSEFVKGVFVEAGFAAERIIVRPNTVGDPGPRPRPPSTSRTVLYAGRLSAEKGLLTLLEAWRKSRLAGLGYTLRLVGDGPMRETLASQLPPSVQLDPWMSSDELRTLMFEARCSVFPSEWLENFGRVIIESMAAGLPVLASDLATPAELVTPLGPGWRVPPGEPERWADALDNVARDDAAVDRAGERSRALWQARFCPDEGVRSLLAVYDTVLTVGRAR